MTILFFMQHLGVGGVIRQSADQIELLNRRGHRASLLAMFTIDDDWRPLWTSSLPAVDVLCGRAPRRAASAVLPLLVATVRLRRRLREQEIDVLYAAQGGAVRFIAWLATRGVRTTVLVWGTQGFAARRPRHLSNWKVVLPHRLCAAVSPSVALLIANTPAGLEHRRQQGWRCRTLLAVPNGIDPGQFYPEPDARLTVRAEWGLGEEPVIGLVARLDPVKDHATFLRAAGLLAARMEGVRFVVVGDGPPLLRRRLESLSRELGLSGRLVWAGVREDMRAVYNALDVLCLSSVREGSPLVIAEAMACGIPCVSTDVGDVAQLIGDTGLIVPVGEPESLAEALEAMVRRLPEVDPLEVRRRVERLYSVDASVDRLEAAFARVARPG